MNIGARKLLRAIQPSASSGGASDAAMLPMLPTGKFEPSPIAMNARDLVEKLCYERFCGAVYLQGEDARGDVSVIVLVNGDCVTGAFLSVGSHQWFGQAAWTNLCSLKVLLQSLVLPVKAPVLEAYGTLLSQAAPPGTGADERRIAQAESIYVAGRLTGALRVNSPEQSLVQFFHQGTSSGVFGVEASGQLVRRGREWRDVMPLPRRARLEIWKSEGVQVLFRSPSPFDATHTRALAGFLNAAFELASHLMPPALARARWVECVHAQMPGNAWMEALCTASVLEGVTGRRVQAWEAALRYSRAEHTALVPTLSALVDGFLEPLAKSIGPQLFREHAAKAIKSADRALLCETGLSSRWLPFDGVLTDSALTKNLVLEAVAGARYDAAPRRVRSRASTFDF